MNKICTRALSCLVLSSAIVLSSAVLVAQTPPTFPPTPSPSETIQSAARASLVYAHEDAESGAIEVLSDLQGTDVRAYLHNLCPKVRASWYALVPADVRTKKGKLAIEFSILKDGSLGQMKFAATSGDRSLDRAAWDGVKAAAPFPPLPAEWKGDHLTLRFRFLYNPRASDLAGIGDALTRAELIKTGAGSNLPQYPEQALLSKIDGIVRLEATVGSDGKVKDVNVLEGNVILAEASIDAIKKWRFHPAQRNHVPIQDLVRVKVEFRLNGEQVTARIAWQKTGSAEIVDREPH